MKKLFHMDMDSRLCFDFVLLISYRVCCNFLIVSLTTEINTTFYEDSVIFFLIRKPVNKLHQSRFKDLDRYRGT